MRALSRETYLFLLTEFYELWKKEIPDILFILLLGCDSFFISGEESCMGV